MFVVGELVERRKGRKDNNLSTHQPNSTSVPYPSLTYHPFPPLSPHSSSPSPSHSYSNFSFGKHIKAIIQEKLIQFWTGRWPGIRDEREGRGSVGWWEWGEGEEVFFIPFPPPLTLPPKPPPSQLLPPVEHNLLEGEYVGGIWW